MRFWFTHRSPNDSLVGLDPIQNRGIKYIAILRNGMDIVASLCPFLASFTDEWRKLWGGFPPKLKTKEECFSLMIDLSPNLIFAYAKNWWKFRKEPNVLLLHYSDLKRDLP